MMTESQILFWWVVHMDTNVKQDNGKTWDQR